MGREVLELDRLTILLTDTEEQWLQAVASTETEEPIESIRVPLGPAGGALAQAYLTQKPIVCESHTPLDESLRLKPPYDQIKSFRSRAFAIIPLVVHGHAIGVLAADRKRSRAGFDPSTLEPLELLASQVAIASEHARLQAASQPLLRRSSTSTTSTRPSPTRCRRCSPMTGSGSSCRRATSSRWRCRSPSLRSSPGRGSPGPRWRDRRSVDPGPEQASARAGPRHRTILFRRGVRFCRGRALHDHAAARGRRGGRRLLLPR